MELGWNVLAGCDPGKIAEAAVSARLGMEGEMLCGDSRTTERIVTTVLR